VDAGALLKLARERARMSQRELGQVARTSKGAVSAIESGTKSPSVRTLDRLLAACGFQVRSSLEPLMADLDARVDAMDGMDATGGTGGTGGEGGVKGQRPELDGDLWRPLADSLDDRAALDDRASLDDGAVGRGSILGGAQRRGPVRWAVDGASALTQHGLSVPLEALDVVVELDEALRFWMKAVQLRGMDAREFLVMDWYDTDLVRMVEALDGVRFCFLGFVRVRVVEVLPRTLSVVVGWLDRPVSVVSVDEVERSHPAYAEVLARRRTRRSLRP